MSVGDWLAVLVALMQPVIAGLMALVVGWFRGVRTELRELSRRVGVVEVRLRERGRR